MTESLIRCVLAIGLVLALPAVLMLWNAGTPMLLCLFPVIVLCVLKHRQSVPEALTICLLGLMIWSGIEMPLKPIVLIVFACTLAGTTLGLVLEPYPLLLRTLVFLCCGCGFVWIVPCAFQLTGLQLSLTTPQLVQASMTGLIVFVVFDCLATGMATLLRLPTKDHDPWNSVQQSASWYN